MNDSNLYRGIDGVRRKLVEREDLLAERDKLKIELAKLVEIFVNELGTTNYLKFCSARSCRDYVKDPSPCRECVRAAIKAEDSK